MVKFLQFRQLLVTAALLLGSLSSYAYDFEVDGIYYDKLTDNTVEVTFKYYDEKEEAIINGYDDKTAIAIPSTVDYGGVSYSVTSIGFGAFFNCSGLASVSIGDEVTSIGDYAFYGCIGLTSLTIGKGVASIGEWSFSCSGLTSVHIPDGVSSIGEGAFVGCEKLASITVGDNNAYFKIDKGVLYSKDMTTLMIYPPSASGGFTVPDGVTSIGSSAFRGCILTSVVLPNSVTSIGDAAFNFCENLASIAISDSVTSIGLRAFYYCTSLTSIEIPDAVASIGIEAFNGCRNLTSITVGENNDNFKGYNGALYNKDMTTLIAYPGASGSFTVPDGVTSIGSSAFYCCDNLTSVTIPDGVTSIGETAFFWCVNLASVTIGKGVTSIELGGFFECCGLKSIVCLADTPPTCGSYAFEWVPRDECTLYVPEASLGLYQSTSPWSDFTNIQATTGIDNVTVDEGKPAVIYDLSGRKLGEPRHGLNIINGKKVVIK